MTVTQPLPHDSATLHVTGQARYVDDMPMPTGTLHLAFGLSTIAKGTISTIDLKAVRAYALLDTRHRSRSIGSIANDDDVVDIAEIIAAVCLGQLQVNVLQNYVPEHVAGGRPDWNSTSSG